MNADKQTRYHAPQLHVTYEPYGVYFLRLRHSPGT